MRNTIALGVFAVLFISAGIPTCAQEFRNLDFESAQLLILPPGQATVPSTTAALPGWTAYLGAVPQSTVYYNGISLDSAGIAVIGANFYEFGVGPPAVPPLEGNFSAILAAGIGVGGPFTASMSQTGVVPSTTRSIQLKVTLSPSEAPQDLSVTLNGRPISLQPISSAPGYTLFGGDVATFSGQTATLTISTASASSFDRFWLDSIEFSPQAIPEPSTPLLFALCGLALLVRWFRPR